MDYKKEMDMDLSEGFVEDIKKLLGYCEDNKTDNLVLSIDVDGIILDIDITFRAYVR